MRSADRITCRSVYDARDGESVGALECAHRDGVPVLLVGVDVRRSHRAKTVKAKVFQSLSHAGHFFDRIKVPEADRVHGVPAP